MIRRLAGPLTVIVTILAGVPLLLLLLVPREAAMQVDVDKRFSAPSADAILGTDHLGRDVATRLAYGTGLSLRAAAVSLTVALSLALILGALSGGRPHSLASFVIDSTASLLLVVPFFLLAVAAAAVLEPGLETTYLLVGLTIWPAPARLVRAEVTQLRRSRFVLAEQAFGFGQLEILRRSYLPLTLLPPLLSLTLMMPELLAVDVGLSFFGLGAQPSTPTLGRLVFQGLMDARQAWWTAAFPLATLFGVCLAVNAGAQALARRVHGAYGGARNGGGTNV